MTSAEYEWPVVVGVRHAGASGAAVRWASTAAELRALPLTVVHVWHEALEVTVDLDPGSLPDAPGPVTCRGVPGPAALALLAPTPRTCWSWAATTASGTPLIRRARACTRRGVSCLLRERARSELHGATDAEPGSMPTVPLSITA